jgi:hypothetical protein
MFISYFTFHSTQQFIKTIQMTYLHEGHISEVLHVSTPNGSPLGTDSS